MVTRRKSKVPAPDLGYSDHTTLPDGRTIIAGQTATVLLPGAGSRRKCAFLRARGLELTFIDPRGAHGLRTVYADAVHTIHKVPR